MHRVCNQTAKRDHFVLMKEPSEKSNKSKAERRRFLNVIYFIDSNRTHTFKLSLQSAIVVASVLAGLLIWSIIGSYLLIDTSLASRQKNERIRSLLGTIFSYQTRYDEVYERSYPDLSVGQLVADNPNTGQEAEPNEAKTTHNQVVSTDTSTTENQASTKTGKSTGSSKISLAAKAAPGNSEGSFGNTKSASVKQPPIGIEDVETKDNEGSMEFSFSLRNLASPELASGYVIGVGKFIDEAGSATTILSPPEVKPDEKIPIYSLSKNHRFSIRYYKKKTLQFDKPEAKKGQFQNVKIVIGDGDGNRKEIVYNLKNEKIDSVEISEGPGLTTQ